MQYSDTFSYKHHITDPFDSNLQLHFYEGVFPLCGKLHVDLFPYGADKMYKASAIKEVVWFELIPEKLPKDASFHLVQYIKRIELESGLLTHRDSLEIVPQLTTFSHTVEGNFFVDQSEIHLHSIDRPQPWNTLRHERKLHYAEWSGPTDTYYLPALLDDLQEGLKTLVQLEDEVCVSVDVLNKMKQWRESLKGIIAGKDTPKEAMLKDLNHTLSTQLALSNEALQAQYGIPSTVWAQARAGNIIEELILPNQSGWCDGTGSIVASFGDTPKHEKPSRDDFIISVYEAKSNTWWGSVRWGWETERYSAKGTTNLVDLKVSTLYVPEFSVGQVAQPTQDEAIKKFYAYWQEEKA